MKIDVDRATCETHALCVYAAPEVFSLDEDDILVYDAAPGPGQDDAVRSAALVCPVQAIRLADDAA